MALINCHECGKEISDQAEACPNCGAPVKKPEPELTLAELAEQQRMKILGRKPRSNAGAVAEGVGNAAVKTYKGGCGLLTLGTLLLGAVALVAFPPVGLFLLVLGLIAYLIRR